MYSNYNKRTNKDVNLLLVLRGRYYKDNENAEDGGWIDKLSLVEEKIFLNLFREKYKKIDTEKDILNFEELKLELDRLHILELEKIKNEEIKAQKEISDQRKREIEEKERELEENKKFEKEYESSQRMEYIVEIIQFLFVLFIIFISLFGLLKLIKRIWYI